MTIDPFAKPQKLLDWAHGAHGTAKRLWLEFMVGKEHRLITEEVPEGGYKIQKVVLLDQSPMPTAVEEHATNALHHLRNAFDQMLYAACEVIGKPVKDGHYPWSTNPNDLDGRFLNKRTGKETIPAEFWDLIRSQEPYPASDSHAGGNTLIRSIAALANSKHTIGLEITAIAEVQLGSVTFQGPGTMILTGMPIPPSPVAFSKGVELLRWSGTGGPKPGYTYNVNVNVGFDASSPTELRLVPALDALVDFGLHAQSCLQGFRARVAALL